MADSSSDNVTIYYEPTGCNCANKTTYSQSAIHAACVATLDLASKGETVGRDKYPHAYNDYEHFSFPHAQPPYFEFPIMSDGSVYNGDVGPGADRVVIGSVAEDYSSAVYCATITHSGSSERNGFVECKDDTVNPNGQGTWDVRKTERLGREPEGERKLLRGEDVKLPFENTHY
ncbi:Ribonuclease/ribotoxin [Diplogelasinospora grovesii]|uniref:ribonuclease T1 n=1 Tax=Diplogelasinospora grovesii TaxID=303347 RepID=A0AAN6RZA0_9PEZI|nr:Ribonuclease/ribotoxin [Diplogelasinospora grovesii]